MDVPAPVVAPPAVDFTLMPPAETPEAAFDMIAAANLQPAATLELDSAPEPDTEEPAAAEDPEDTPSSDPEASILPQEGAEDEEIQLDEVKLYFCTFCVLVKCFSVHITRCILLCEQCGFNLCSDPS